MPDGKTHLHNWKKAAPIAAGLSCGFLLFQNWHITIPGYLLGYGIGYFVTPDADQLGLTSEDGRLMKRFGPFGFLVVIWFTLYAYICQYVGLGGKRGHRGLISHGIFIGSTIRLAWLLFLPALAVLYFRVPVPEQVTILILGALTGLSVADYLHSAADFAWLPFSKRRRRL